MGIVQDVHIPFCIGVVFNKDDIMFLRKYLKDGFTFIEFARMIPKWRFVNDVCPYSFPYNNNNVRNTSDSVLSSGYK